MKIKNQTQHREPHTGNSTSSILEESEVGYAKTKIAGLSAKFRKVSVSTWEEQQNHNYEYSANLTPEQRLAYLKELNDKAFGIKEDKPLSDKRIKFD